MQPNKVNANGMDYGRWNKWDGLWIEGNQNETLTMKCGLKEKRWNMSNEVDNVTLARALNLLFTFLQRPFTWVSKLSLLSILIFEFLSVHGC